MSYKHHVIINHVHLVNNYLLNNTAFQLQHLYTIVFHKQCSMVSIIAYQSLWGLVFHKHFMESCHRIHQHVLLWHVVNSCIVSGMASFASTGVW